MCQGGMTLCALRPTPRPPQGGVACKIEAHNAERARFCDISCSKSVRGGGSRCPVERPSALFRSYRVKTHLARFCQERPPDGEHRLRQQTSGGDPSFSGGYHRLFPQKEMGVHIPRRPKGRLPPFFPRKEPGVHIPRRHKRPPSAFRRKRGRGYISPYEAPLLALL